MLRIYVHGDPVTRGIGALDDQLLRKALGRQRHAAFHPRKVVGWAAAWRTVKWASEVFSARLSWWPSTGAPAKLTRSTAKLTAPELASATRLTTTATTILAVWRTKIFLRRTASWAATAWGAKQTSVQLRRKRIIRTGNWPAVSGNDPKLDAVLLVELVEDAVPLANRQRLDAGEDLLRGLVDMAAGRARGQR